MRARPKGKEHMRNLAKMIVTGLLASGLAGAAIADEWHAKSHSDENSSKEVIFSGDETSNGILFLCTGGSLAAYVATEPGDISERMQDFSAKARALSVRLAAGDRTYEADRWIHMPRMRILVPPSSASAALYNAVVRGDAVTIERRARSPITITPPPMNDAFKDFGSGCGLGRNRATS